LASLTTIRRYLEQERQEQEADKVKALQNTQTDNAKPGEDEKEQEI
jgi:hypothetical protein